MEEELESPLQSRRVHNRGQTVLVASEKKHGMVGGVVLRATSAGYDILLADGSILPQVAAWRVSAADWRGHYIAVRNLNPQAFEGKKKLNVYRKKQRQWRAESTSMPEVAVEAETGRLRILVQSENYDDSLSDGDVLLRYDSSDAIPDDSGINPLLHLAPVLLSDGSGLFAVGDLQYSSEEEHYYVEGYRLGNREEMESRLVLKDVIQESLLNTLARFTLEDGSLIFYGRHHVGEDRFQGSGFKSWQEFEENFVHPNLFPIRLPDSILQAEDVPLMEGGAALIPDATYFRALVVVGFRVQLSDILFQEQDMKRALDEVLQAAEAHAQSEIQLDTEVSKMQIGVTIEEVKQSSELSEEQREQALFWLTSPLPKSAEELHSISLPEKLPAGSSKLMLQARKRYTDRVRKAKGRLGLDTPTPGTPKKVGLEDILSKLPETLLQQISDADKETLREFHEWSAESETPAEIRPLTAEEQASPVRALIERFRKRALDRRSHFLRTLSRGKRKREEKEKVVKEVEEVKKKKKKKKKRKLSVSAWRNCLPISWWKLHHLQEWLAELHLSPVMLQALQGYAGSVRWPVRISPLFRQNILSTQKSRSYQEQLEQAEDMVTSGRELLVPQAQLVAAAAYNLYASVLGKELQDTVLDDMELSLWSEHARAPYFRESAIGKMQRCPITQLFFGDNFFWKNLDSEDVPFYSEGGEEELPENNLIKMVAFQPLDVVSVLPLPLDSETQARFSDITSLYRSYRRETLEHMLSAAGEEQVSAFPRAPPLDVQNYSSLEQLIDEARKASYWSWEVVDRAAELLQSYLREELERRTSFQSSTTELLFQAAVLRESTPRADMLKLWSIFGTEKQLQHVRLLLQLSSRIQPQHKDGVCDITFAQSVFQNPQLLSPLPDMGSSAAFSEDAFDLFIPVSADSLLVMELVSGDVETLSLEAVTRRLFEGIQSGRYIWIRTIKSFLTTEEERQERSVNFQQADGCGRALPVIQNAAALEGEFRVPDVSDTALHKGNSGQWRQQIQELWSHFSTLHNFFLEEAAYQRFAKYAFGIPQRLGGMLALLRERAVADTRAEVEAEVEHLAEAWTEIITGWILNPEKACFLELTATGPRPEPESTVTITRLEKGKEEEEDEDDDDDDEDFVEGQDDDEEEEVMEQEEEEESPSSKRESQQKFVSQSPLFVEFFDYWDSIIQKKQESLEKRRERLKTATDEKAKKRIKKEIRKREKALYSFPFPTKLGYLYHAFCVHYFATRLADFLPEYGKKNKVYQAGKFVGYADGYFVQSASRTASYPKVAPHSVREFGRFAEISRKEKGLVRSLEEAGFYPPIRWNYVDTAFTDIVLAFVRATGQTQNMELSEEEQQVELTTPDVITLLLPGAPGYKVALNASEMHLLAYRLKTHFEIISSEVTLQDFSDKVKGMLPPGWRSAFQARDEMEITEVEEEELVQPQPSPMETETESSVQQDELALRQLVLKSSEMELYEDINDAVEARESKRVKIQEEEENEVEDILLEEEELPLEPQEEEEEAEETLIPEIEEEEEEKEYYSILPTQPFHQTLSEQKREARNFWIDALHFFLLDTELGEEGPAAWNRWLDIESVSESVGDAILSYGAGLQTSISISVDEHLKDGTPSRALLLFSLPWRESYAWVYQEGAILFPYNFQLGVHTLDSFIKDDPEYSNTATEVQDFETFQHLLMYISGKTYYVVQTKRVETEKPQPPQPELSGSPLRGDESISVQRRLLQTEHGTKLIPVRGPRESRTIFMANVFLDTGDSVLTACDQPGKSLPELLALAGQPVQKTKEAVERADRVWLRFMDGSQSVFLKCAPNVWLRIQDSGQDNSLVYDLQPYVQKSVSVAHDANLSGSSLSSNASSYSKGELLRHVQQQLQTLLLLHQEHDRTLKYRSNISQLLSLQDGDNGREHALCMALQSSLQTGVRETNKKMEHISGAKTWDERYFKELWYLYLQLPSLILKGVPIEERGSVESAFTALLNVTAELDKDKKEFHSLSTAIARLGKESAELLERGADARREVEKILSSFEETVLSIIEKKEESRERVQVLFCAQTTVAGVHKAATLVRHNKATATDLLELYLGHIQALVAVPLQYSGMEIAGMDVEEEEEAPSENEEEEEGQKNKGTTAEEEEAQSPHIGNIVHDLSNVLRVCVCKTPRFYKLSCEYSDALLGFFHGSYPLLSTLEKEKLQVPRDNAPLTFNLTEHTTGECIQKAELQAVPGVYFLERSCDVSKPLGQLFEAQLLRPEEKRYFTICGSAALCLQVKFRQSMDACTLDITALLDVDCSCDTSPYRYRENLSGFFIDVYFERRDRTIATPSSDDDPCAHPVQQHEAAISKIRVYMPFRC